MSERIDHAEKARTILDRTLGALSAGEIPGEEAVPAVGMAQVHATLALVEQQRIANLIAVTGWVVDAGKDDVRHDLNKLGVGQADAVWEALGLS